MTEPAGRPASSPRTWRQMVLWTAGILLALGLVWFVGAVMVPYYQGREAAKCGSVDPVGSPAQVARNLDIYLRVSRIFARKDEEVTRQGEGRMRLGAAEMLYGMDGDWAFSALCAALKDPDWKIRDLAVQALGRYRDHASESVPLLIEALKDPDYRVRSHAANSLGEIGPAAAEAVPALIAAWRLSLGQESDPWRNQLDVWHFACWSVPGIGKGAPEAVEMLVQALGDKDPRIRANAACSLGLLGWGTEETKKAIPALEALQNDPDESVRECARTAIQAIREGRSQPDGGGLSLFILWPSP